ncbi:MAG: hypothetical protein EOP09_08765 [Proteobacteria bacterium]|nr:MAG: hypothetical protein EOP09_08765 [Pseudomonadota bacterium]
MRNLIGLHIILAFSAATRHERTWVLVCISLLSLSAHAHSGRRVQLQQSFHLSSTWIDRATDQSETLKQIGLWEDAQKLKANWNRIERKTHYWTLWDALRSIFSGDSFLCRKTKSQANLAFTSHPRILLCSMLSQLSVSDIAQTLIHESQHLVGERKFLGTKEWEGESIERWRPGKTEGTAVQVELAISILGGTDPYLSGHFRWQAGQLKCAEQDCNPDWLKWVTESLELKTEQSFQVWDLRTLVRQVEQPNLGNLREDQLGQLVNQAGSLRGYTPLMEAAENNRLEWLELFSKVDSLNPTIRSNSGLTAYDIALKSGNVDFARRMKQLFSLNVEQVIP